MNDSILFSFFDEVLKEYESKIEFPENNDRVSWSFSILWEWEVLTIFLLDEDRKGI